MSFACQILSRIAQTKGVITIGSCIIAQQGYTSACCFFHDWTREPVTDYGIYIKAKDSALIQPVYVCASKRTMMIKLFLITLLCVAVFGDSPADEVNQMWTGPAKAMADAAHRFMTDQGSSLVRRAAPPQDGPPQGGPPPRGGQGQQE